MDQAAKLRELTNKRSTPLKSVDFISVISGKGGVGKTTLVTNLYDNVENPFIVDCDINSPYFWFHQDEFQCCEGFEFFKGRNVIKRIDKSKNIDKYKTVLIDAGTGLNEINGYFIEKSKIVVFVSTMEEISILNTMNLMKRISPTKILFLPGEDDESITDMKQRIRRYSKQFLNGSYVLVTNDVNEILITLNKNR